MPVAEKSVAIGYGYSIKLYRIGNFVFGNELVLNTGIYYPDGKQAALGETIPDGFRPKTSSHIFGIPCDSRGTGVGIDVSATGTLRYTTSGSRSASYLAFLCHWLTDDDWPS